MKRFILLILLILPVFFIESFGQNSLKTALNAGSYSRPFHFRDGKSTSSYSDSYIYYKFSISSPMDIFISTCGSSLTNSNTLHLYNSSESSLGYGAYISNPGICSNGKFAYMEIPNLSAGTYYIMCDWYGGTGNLVINIEGVESITGNTISNPIDLGNQFSSFQYTDTRNTQNYKNTYGGRSTSDVFYRFTLECAMDITISHCGSALSDTYVHLLNSEGNSIGFNNDYSGAGACTNSRHAYLKKEKLAAGTYYIVSEGYNQNGNISTNIQGISEIELSNDRNYIMTSTPTIASSKPNALTADYCLRSVQYFDGIGRPEQIIQIGANPDKHDLANYHTYDAFGREETVWLPVAASGNKGSFIPFNNAFREIANSSTYPNDSKPYTMTKYENSPLSRILEDYGPGQLWHNNGKAIKTEYTSNTSTDTCRLYKFTGTDNSIEFTSNGIYTKNQLYVAKTCDEDGKNITYEFKDKLGQIVLTRQMNNNDPHDTYYVYDDYGNLRVVIPPMLADSLPKLKIPWNETTPIVDQHAYLYKYDNRNRCIGKKLPGTEWITYVYDKADRLILTQDGEQFAKSSKEWSFNIPDSIGRILLTGTCGDFTEEALNNIKNNIITASRTDTTDIYKGYSLINIKLPKSAKILTVSYYDDYNFMGYNTIPASTNNHIKYEALSGFGTQYTASHKGLLTGTMTAQLDNSTMLYSVMYYDYRGRVIQTKSNNHLAGGYEKEYIAYNFSSQPIKKKHIHIATGKATQTEEYVYTYDHTGRLKQTTHKLNSGAVVVLASNKYDKLGKLTSSKKSNLPETVYTYNIRSWINRIYTAGLFDETLYYNEKHLQNTPSYNGNITTMTWRVRAPHLAGLRGYSFEYDDLSRLKVANYQYNDRTNIWDYYMFTRYDKNGNIEGFYRRGKGNGWDFPVVDIVNMYYNGNQLIRLEDTGADINSLLSGDIKDYKNEAIEYTYNRNGAITKDLNKGVSSISYNLLNLPSQLAISNRLGTGTNKYIYTANGNKLQVSQEYTPKGKTKKITTTDYVGNKVYENGSLKLILVDGGYISMPDKTYYYHLTDHLGSVRLTVKSDGTIAQELDYYPFGIVCGQISEADQSFQPYKYNGKEMDRMAGLNLYDYGARYMDPAIGRFTTMDPLAEKYYNISPYAYCANNPVRYIDPTGEDWRDFLNGIVDGAANKINALGYAVVHPIETVKHAYIGFMDKSLDEKLLSVVDLYTMGAISSNTGLFSAVASDLNGGNGSSTGEFIGGTVIDVTVAAGGIKVGGVISKGLSSTTNAVTETINSITKPKVGNLGNPFKNMTLDQVRTSMDKHVKTGKLNVIYTDKSGSNQIYINTKSGYSYNLDKGGPSRIGRQKIIEGPHIDINYPKPKPVHIEKKKLPVQ